MTILSSAETSFEQLKSVQETARRLAFEYLSSAIEPAHLLRAVLMDEAVIEVLNDLDKDLYYLEEWAEIRIENLPKVSKQSPELSLSDKSQNCFIVAEDIGNEIGVDTVSPILLLAALSVHGVAFTYDQFKTFPLQKDELLKAIHAPISNKKVLTNQGGVNKSSNDQKDLGGMPKLLGKYYHSMNMDVLDSTRHKVVGRDTEIEYTIEILNRYIKPNVLIIGEPGVGKTVLVDGLVDAIVSGKVPANLKNATVFKLDYSNISVGASYKGEVEDRLKKVFEEIKQFEKPLLFIDEINVLLTKNQGNEGQVNLLKSELEKGDVTLIASAGMDEYRKTIENDRSINRRFEIVKLEEPSVTVAKQILKSVLPVFCNHHGLAISEDSMIESIKLSKRYVKDKKLPDAAIDLIDRTMSNTKVAIGECIVLLQSLKKITGEDNSGQLSNYKDELLRLSAKELIDFKELIEELDNLISQKEDSSEIVRSLLELANEKLKEVKAIKSISSGDLTRVIAKKTGIPIGRLQTDEKERLMQLEEELSKRVVGQDVAISSIASAILESRSGLTKEGQPIGSFFLMGPTGTGKTELAKALTEYLFGDELDMIRLDMSEFKEEHSAALLYGAPPGYVGYEEGGLLVNKIREKPYSVVLFDEIEKAHPSVFDIFLQILDEGKLHDRLGKEGDFSNTVILFTSNIGSEYIVEKYAKGEIPGQKILMDIMSNHFRPEFLGRLTELIPFGPIDQRVVIDIINIQLKEIYERLAPKNITLEISDTAKQLLALHGYTPEYGARPLKGIIRAEIRKKLSKMIIYEEITEGDHIFLDALNGEFVWKIESVNN